MSSDNHSCNNGKRNDRIMTSSPNTGRTRSVVVVGSLPSRQRSNKNPQMKEGGMLRKEPLIKHYRLLIWTCLHCHKYNIKTATNEEEDVEDKNE